MTINKIQGQTLDHVSIWLGDDHVFTHGQLNFALSKVSTLNKIKIVFNEANNVTKSDYQ